MSYQSSRSPRVLVDIECPIKLVRRQALSHSSPPSGADIPITAPTSIVLRLRSASARLLLLCFAVRLHSCTYDWFSRCRLLISSTCQLYFQVGSMLVLIFFLTAMPAKPTCSCGCQTLVKPSALRLHRNEFAHTHALRSAVTSTSSSVRHYATQG